MAELKTRRIILLGKTGAGKSSLANTIFREKLFGVLSGFISGTSDCEAKTKPVNGRKLTLIDTPGFFDTKRHEEEMKPEIVRCITECSPGPHAFLIVLKVERFTDQEEAVIHRMTKYFSEDVYKYATVVFTHGDELPEGDNIKDFVKQNKSLSDIIEKCGGRCHVFDNKHWNNDSENNYRSNEYQVEEILQSIEKTVEANNGECYTNKMLQEIERIIQQEEKMIRKTSENMSKEEIRKEAKKRERIIQQEEKMIRKTSENMSKEEIRKEAKKRERIIQQEEKMIRKTSENMSEEEIREEAKNRVNKRLIKATGITVGALLGALFGLALPVAVVTAGLAGGMTLTIRAVGVKTAAGTAAGVTARAAGAAEVAGAAEAGAAGGVMGAGLTAGVAVVGVLAAVGAGLGGFEGHQAAQAAETKQEAAEMAAKAVGDKGLKLIEGVYNLASQINKEVKYIPLEEKDSKCKTPH